MAKFDIEFEMSAYGYDKREVLKEDDEWSSYINNVAKFFNCIEQSEASKEVPTPFKSDLARGKFKRGDVYWVDLGRAMGSEMRKVRPCVLIGASSINKTQKTVVVVPLSSSSITKKKQKQTRVQLDSLNNDGKKSYAVCDQIRAVDKRRLKHKAGSISLKDTQVLESGLRQVFSL